METKNINFTIMFVGIILSAIGRDCSVDFITFNNKNRFLITDNKSFKDDLLKFNNDNLNENDVMEITKFKYDEDYNRLNIFIKIGKEGVVL